MDRILITGLGGFVGQHLARLLLESNHENVYGSVVDLNVESDLPLPKDRILPCDLLDETAVTRLLEEVQPHQIYHVAGIAEVGRSWGNPKPAYCVNVLGARSVFTTPIAYRPYRPSLIRYTAHNIMEIVERCGST